MKISEKAVKDLLVPAALTLTLIVGVFIGTHSILSPSANEQNVLTSQQQIKQKFPVNENGQTYGSIVNCVQLEDFPVLIQAASKTGIEGYVFYSDLYGDQPNTREEAIEYMENLRKLNSEGIYFKIVPLYKSDGISIIGEYEVSLDARLFQTESEREKVENENIWERGSDVTSFDYKISQ